MADDTMNEQQRQFEKLRREIAVATREQGGDPDENRRLRVALERAADVNMPESMIERARQHGADETTYQEKLYEGYGHAGIAVLVRTITDDPSATHTELQHLFEEYGGNLGDEGCVAWQFERRGMLEVASEHVDDPDLFLLEVMEMGGQELTEPVGGDADGASRYRIYCEPDDLDDLDEAVTRSYPVESSSIVYEPTQHVPVEPPVARRFLGFFETLLERVDVQRAHANWTFA